MTDTGTVTLPTATAPVNKRGREGAVDMVRSLGVVMVLVAALWFFGQASPGDSQQVRRVDPSLQLKDFQAANPGQPVPVGVPAGWIPNVATYDGALLRVGYVIDRQGYLEFSAGTGARFVAEQTGTTAQASTAQVSTAQVSTAQVSTVDVAGTPWQRVRSGNGHESLVRVVQGMTLVVGGLREKASLAQLEQLAQTVR